ncbi:filamentous hemagglutinin N-terminal domain-containing protein [Roseococcus sp. SYP-B2431]|uniref:beta strand repeat-containing protein n=1 Tax=Roseococcus sp. SYP-B2431 TaxID=2496640 RepID=UPI0013F414AD|nr:filamentous hemagglutinin N-terminal domain-containing protein [Roseococcus sp. SYP-B2431]
MTPSPSFRLALLAGTALFFPALAQAQPAPNARPQGGQVVAGSAVIGGDAGRTVINQSTDRAAINWQSFDVGRNQAVQFQQPSTTSVTLNRVITPNPSQIAGRITANGQVAIVNQSGVVFHQGAQIDAAGFVASTANITNEAFMRGGRMNFDQPGRPDARIENHGTITVREAGLAALVAPQVANHGVIRARMGRVVLAGAETSVVDLHGDGLLSLEVTSPVRQAPANGQALVTNTGTVTATGGTVVLTAQAVDGIVQDLVRAGGRIAANTDGATGRSGRVVAAGNGGAVRIEGRVSAQGRAAGTRGGEVQILGDRTLVDSTARVNASGRAGGGTVAIGVTPNGAASRRLSRRAGIAQGAVVRADATERGNGGTVLLNSSEYTVHAGAISVRGGPQGGDGGFVEVSSARDFRLLGEVNVAAGPGGRVGTLLIDPDNLTVIAAASGSGSDDGNVIGGVLDAGASSGDQTISNGFINAFAGNLVLQADDTILVDAPINKPTGNLSLEAGTTLTVGANGSIVLGAGDLGLTAQTFVFNGPVTVPLANTISFTATGSDFPSASISQTVAGVVTAGTVTQTNPNLFGDVGLGTADNVIGAIGTLNAALGNVTIRNTRSLTVNTGIAANVDARIDVIGGDLTINGNISAATGTAVFRSTGSFTQGAASTVRAPNMIISSGLNASLAAIDPTSTAGTFIAGIIQAGPAISYFEPTGLIVMNAGRGGIVQTGGSLEANTLSLNTTGNISLPGGDSANRIDEITSLTAAGDASVASRPGSAFNLTLSGPMQVGGTFSLNRTGGGNIIQTESSVITANTLNVTNATNGAQLTGENQVARLGTVDVQSAFDFRNATSLAVTGPVAVENATASIDVVGDLDVTGSVSGQGGITLTASGNINLAAGSLVGQPSSFGGGITILAGYNPNIEGGSDLNGPSSLTLGGTLGNAGFPAQVELGAGTGGITQTGGRLIASSLIVLSGGDVLLDLPSPGLLNSVANLNTLHVAGNFALDNGVSDLQVGLSGDTISTQSFAVRTAGTVTVNAAITAVERATFRVGSLAFSPFTGTPLPSITAPLVELAPDAALGMAILPDEGTPQPFRLGSDIFDRITASNFRFGATTFRGVTTTTASEINFASSFSLPGTVDVRATGDVFQAAGTTLGFGTLTGAAGGAVELNDPANVLPVIGDLSAGTLLALRTTGSQVLTGNLAAPNTLLTTGGSLTQSGAGRITGGTLTLQTGGDALLNGANGLTGLGASDVGGRLELKNSSDQLALPAGRVFFTQGSYDIQQTGNLVVDGTVTGTTGALAATGTLQVNGNSAIARTGDLSIESDTFALNGLLQAAGAIRIAAGTSASLTGTASGTSLRITSPSITFGGLNASSTPVLLFLGPDGNATGTLSAGALSVFGGAGANLFGAIAGISGGAAAATGRRGTSGGSLLVEPLPSPALYLFNDCAIGASVCTPAAAGGGGTATPPAGSPLRIGPFLAPTVNPPLLAAVLEPALTAIQQLRPPVPVLSFRLFRDRSEEGELAPPNIRGEDF